MNTIDNVKKAVQDLRSLLETATKLTGGNPSDGPLWYSKKALEWIDAAVELSGFVVGQKARLTRDVPCTGGWVGDEHNLLAGKAGVVIDLDFTPSKGTLVLFVPDDQTWIPIVTWAPDNTFKGVPKPVIHPHSFWINASYFE